MTVARYAFPGVNLMERVSDIHAEGCTIPPLWTDQAVKFDINPPQYAKNLCPQRELLRNDPPGQAVHTRRCTTQRDRKIVRTRTNAAVVPENITLGWRVCNHCSTVKTELVAISAALTPARLHENTGITYTQTQCLPCKHYNNTNILTTSGQ